VGLERDELSINVSTGSQVSRRTAGFEPGSYQTRKYFGGDFLNTITHLPAGRSLNVLVDLLSELARAEGVALKDAWNTIRQRVAEVDQTDLRVDLSFFGGPLGSSGRIEGITTGNLTVGQLFQAAFHSMADNYAACAERLCPERPWRRIALSGGLPQALPRIRELIQDRFDVPLREPAVGEETLTGLLEIAIEPPRHGGTES
jgi:hypothetical protein